MHCIYFDDHGNNEYHLRKINQEFDELDKMHSLPNNEREREREKESRIIDFWYLWINVSDMP